MSKNQKVHCGNCGDRFDPRNELYDNFTFEGTEYWICHGCDIYYGADEIQERFENGHANATCGTED